MDLELITIGDELLLGFTVDTNAVFIARTLADLGIRVTRRATVGDTPEAIAAAVREALERTGAVLTTGGLGPTSDDLTHEGIARAFGVPLSLHEEGLAKLAERWQARFGREMPESNARQFQLPVGADVLANAHGSAPGIWLSDEAGRVVATMPGVPREMRGMLLEQIVPRLEARRATGNDSAADAPVIRSRTLRTVGISESALADRLAGAEGLAGDVSLAFLPGADGVDLRLTLHGRPAAEADGTLEAAVAVVRSRVGRWVYGENEDDLAELVLQSLIQHGHWIAVAESCTGGMLGARLTAIPGSSRAVLGGVIAYDNRIKTEQLDVPADLIVQHGAVSEAVARAMASGVRARFAADVGVGITGIAGPGGGSPEKPVGTVWVAVDMAGDVHAVVATLPGDRQEIRHRATQLVLDRVRRVYEGATSLPGWTVSAAQAAGREDITSEA